MGHADSSSTPSGVVLLGVTRRGGLTHPATHLAALQGCGKTFRSKPLRPEPQLSLAGTAYFVRGSFCGYR
jgi:hypothetical protein